MDVLAVEAAAKEAVDYVRAGRSVLPGSPTYRFRAHSMFDAELYRGKPEVEEWKHREPITLLTRVKERGFAHRRRPGSYGEKASAEVQHAVDFAEAGTWEPDVDRL